MIKNKDIILHVVIVFLLFLFISNNLISQCSSTITSFPYTEDFETIPSWTSGGTNSDWAWGTPAHPTIASAGSGIKCWMVGGITGSFYNYSEQSWLESPCFNFSSLNYPWISFKIFWEEEWKFDGMVLQSSTDGGITWINVGSYGDPVNCLNDNWYNYNNITWLTNANPKHGWAGRSGTTSGACQGGHGSLGWVTAKHCLPTLANQTNVKFRFLFGTGTSCNSYDGIAIDDILIQEAEPNTALFTYTCTNSNTVSFNNSSTLCPTGYSWDFDDPGSGTSNSSTQQNPTHTFSSSGTFNVTLTTIGPCNAPGSVTIPVTILSVTISTTTPSCSNSNDGAALANVVGGNGSYSFSWSPNGETSNSINNLSPGSYSVTVTDSNACPASANATINSQTPVNLTIHNPASVCLPATVDITANSITSGSSSGGTLSYWTDTSATQPLSSPNLIANSGTYYIKLTLGNCYTIQPVTVTISPSPIINFNLNNNSGCTPLCVDFMNSSTISNGTITSWEWYFGSLDSSIQQNPHFCFNSAGIYSITLKATSSEMCTSTYTSSNLITVFAGPVASFSFSPYPATIDDPTIHFINQSSVDVNSWLWNFGEGQGEDSLTFNPIHSYPDSIASYTVKLVVHNVYGCSDSTTQELNIYSNFTFFAPDAFSPNNDGINDYFSPKGTGWSPKSYSLMIFDRWGNLCFQTTDSSTGWNGKNSNGNVNDISDVYVWKAQVADVLNNVHYYLGTITLIR